MPKNYLDVTEQRYANIWLKHTFFEIIQNNFRNVYSWNYDEADWSNNDISNPFKEMWTMITSQAWDLNGRSDKWLSEISNISYSDCVYGSWNNGTKFDFKAEQIAAILIDMCNKCKLYWDDTLHTKQEKDYFTKHTIFGRVLADYDCFVSGGQPISTTAQSSSTATTSSNSTASTPRQPKQPRQTNSFRALGPLSDKARDIKSGSHIKEYLSETWKIVDTSAPGAKETRAFIRPLNPKGEQNGTNLVWVGNANNYGDCTCLFDSFDKADEYRRKIEAANPNLSTLTVSKQKVDANGYFIIGTMYGDVYIRADNLNEELKEEINTEEVDVVKRGTKEFDDMLKETCDKWNEYLG